MTSVLVAGALANKPFNGGEAWVRLSWLLGLRRLGLDVHLVEQISSGTCIGRDGKPAPFEASVNLEYFRSVIDRFGLSGSATLICENGVTEGLALPDVLDLADGSDLLVNISGHLTLESLLVRITTKAFIDLDPGFTQFWHAAGAPGSRIEGHDIYFTVGGNVGTAACLIPTSGIDWRPVRQPVLLEEWPPSTEGIPGRFTTVAAWRPPYGPVEYEGRRYGLKHHEFRKLATLPTRTTHTFEASLDIHPADHADQEALRRHGWRLVDTRSATGYPDAFRRYVQGSGGEFSPAQGLYVETKSGWFSDRSTRYLASAKPVLVQDTGFGRELPVGEGVVAFRTLDEAITGANRIVRDYRGHCEAARAIAEEYFDSDRVLGAVMAQVGIE